MQYVVRREMETAECLTLYSVAESMAYTDCNLGGYIYLQDIQEKIDAYMERFLLDARAGKLRLTDHNGISKSIDEIIASIPPDRILPDSNGKSWSEEKREIYTYLPMLDDWGRSFGYSFVFAKSQSEITHSSGYEIHNLGRKTDWLVKPPDRATLHDAAEWLTKESGIEWTARSVLVRLYELAEECACPNSSEILTGAEFIVPKGTVFGSYSGNPKISGEFRSLHKLDVMSFMPKFSLALSKAYAKTLLKKGKADVDLVLDSQNQIYVVVEPLGDTISLTIEMIRISADRLIGLLCISRGKESRLMPVENAYSFSGGSLFDSNYDDHANTTWHALNNTAFEHSWSCEEATYLLDNPDLTCDSPHIDLLKILKTRPLGNYYAEAIKQILAEESVLPDVDVSIDSVSVRDTPKEHDIASHSSSDQKVAESVHTKGSTKNIVSHKIGKREPTIMSTEIAKAQELAPASTLPSIWNELTKLAEQGYGVMIGFSSDGIQYRGRNYQISGMPDILTRRSLRERLARQDV